ncbi:hypothetical protein [Litoreibacter janthinus]|uniref:Dephospho-CoA kinase n=1 Tax=Litoreibacter janthinus TaxID=670154 RepID=A0A1I6HSD0_9RHOB|nr:hypothetical protein [Litoreibacter janthinus]SFR57170.1 Dephospho-CoA kinase [Litoreibacter janthinus]
MTEQVIALVGMPGVGKFRVSDAFAILGYKSYEMSSVIKGALASEGIAVSPASMKQKSFSIRDAHGEAAIAAAIWGQISSDARTRVVVDGIRSMAEIEYFRERVDRFAVVFCFAPTEVRHNRILAKSKKIRTKDEVRLLDANSIALGIGEAALLADYLLDLTETWGAASSNKVRTIAESLEKREDLPTNEG